MKWEDIKEKSKEELEAELEQLRRKLTEERFRVSTNASRQVHQIRVLRRTLARLLTRLAQLEK